MCVTYAVAGMYMKPSNDTAPSILSVMKKESSNPRRFIDAFKNVVCAPNERQMEALWRSFINGQFPQEAIDHVKKQYYESSCARQIMECYVFDCGNLHQTTTSRNEGSHAAYRSKTSVIQKPAESYLLCCKHKQQWMLRLRSKAANACNRIPLDIQATPELYDLAGKISLFALYEIKRQIILAKCEESQGRIPTWAGRCGCHAYCRYGLPCWHMVSTDGTRIALENIAAFWRLDNWEQGLYPTTIYR